MGEKVAIKNLRRKEKEEKRKRMNLELNAPVLSKVILLKHHIKWTTMKLYLLPMLRPPRQKNVLCRRRRVGKKFLTQRLVNHTTTMSQTIRFHGQDQQRMS